ncbi:hypothetical protein ACFOVU_06450 [Nocardiopsis sediminis]|uniref:SRPBCC family protein n=1 Tax=Nocardiopsis sediminis TaxID=1778267 RepID=A0ABV8FKW1_9ACTN
MGLRRTALPREVRDRLRLERGERVLAHAESTEGTLVATTRALHLPDGHPVPWEHIDRARWTDTGLRFTEEGVGQRVFTIDHPGTLAEAVYERVTASIVVAQHVPLPDEPSGRGIRLAARRAPGGTEITWQVHIDDGIDPDDPRLPDHTARALAAMREQMGV